MKKLDEIPKKDPFTTPEGYFERLPAQISARLEQKPGLFERPVFRYSWQLALPVLILAIAGIWWLNNSEDDSKSEMLLAQIETIELMDYLADADALSYEDFIEEMNPNGAEADSLEQSVFKLSMPDGDLDELLNDIDINSL